MTVNDFISCFFTIQDIASFYWLLSSFKVTVDVNIWILIHIFCRKCSNASLNEFIASLPVDTLKVYHMETLKM